MHGRSQHRSTTVIPRSSDPRRIQPLRPTGAVTWIDGRHALVAHTTPAGADVVEVRRGGADELAQAYLARVVDEIGDRERVLVLGPDAFRVQLEREYVAIEHRPERILDGAVVEPTDGAELLARLKALTDR